MKKYQVALRSGQLIVLQASAHGYECSPSGGIAFVTFSDHQSNVFAKFPFDNVAGYWDTAMAEQSR